MYRYLFGPVPSRRLGMSLGVDLVSEKICTLNCIYCESGKTTNLTSQRKEYTPYQEVVNELTDFFKNNQAPAYITFSGNGEPTLNSRIGEVIRFIKLNFSEISVAVITNGTLLYDKQVREDLIDADLVIPSLDAVSDSIFRKINRPLDSFTIRRHIYGLTKFRREFSGNYWLEIFIVPGVNNDIHELALLKRAIQIIKPDKIQLNSLDRPGTESSFQTATKNDLQKVLNFLGGKNIEIISNSTDQRGAGLYQENIEAVILQTIFRRPCTLDDLTKIIGLHSKEVKKYLKVLQANNQVKKVKQTRGYFFQKIK